MQAVNVGIVGLGNVGGGTLEILRDNAATIEARLGFPLRVRAVCSPSIDTTRSAVADGLPADVRRTTDWRDVVDDPDIHVVAELIGGTVTAAELISAAIAAGKSVVTANKALMALRGVELWEQARAAGVSLQMEASVAGGIPIHAVLREGIAGDRIQDRKSTRLNSSHSQQFRMPSSA